jgi:hypothetical protein
MKIAAASIRRLRLVAGLAMLLYVTTHLVKHAMGLVSIVASAAGLPPVEGSPPAPRLIPRAAAARSPL